MIYRLRFGYFCEMRYFETYAFSLSDAICRAKDYFALLGVAWEHLRFWGCDMEGVRRSNCIAAGV